MGEPTNGEGTGATDAGASKTPRPLAESVPEPVILEEHVVAPATPPAPSATAPQAAPPVSTLKPAPIEIPKPEAGPVPLMPKPAAAPPMQPPAAGAPAQPAAAKGGAMSNIANMLQMIKLPERKDAPTAEPKRTYDTSLSIDPKSQAAAEAARTQALKKAEAAAHAITESLPNTTDTTVDDVRALHTLKDDLQHVVRDKKISLVRAVALEEEKRHHGSATEEHIVTQARKQKRTRYGLFVASILFFLGTLAIGAVLYVMAERTQKAAAPITAAVLFSEQSAPLPVDNLAPADIRREIGNARLSALTLGAILEIIPVKQVDVDGTTRMAPLTFTEFLAAIGTRAPAELPRALADQFFIGLHTVDENAPIIVIPVVSYERAFAAMLEWEKDMNSDLSPIFTPVPPQAIDANGLPGIRRFEDTVMRNYDVRALKDDSGTIQLYYSFPTRNVLVIGESPYSFSEVLSRLRADRKL
jgi:hypothetical protein